MSALPQTQPQTLPEALNVRARREGWPTICEDGLVFAAAKLNDLAGIWETVRGARALPMRSDFSARVLVRHLRDVAIVECVQTPGEQRRFRFGFYGSALVRYTGEFTGKFLDEIISEKFIANWNACYDTALAHSGPLRIVSQFHALNLEHMTTESLLAPLGDASGVPCGLLVSAVYSPRVT